MITSAIPINFVFESDGFRKRLAPSYEVKMTTAASSIDRDFPEQRIRPDFKPAGGKRPIVDQ
jgi:hypothetical protein